MVDLFGAGVIEEARFSSRLMPFSGRADQSPWLVRALFVIDVIRRSSGSSELFSGFSPIPGDVLALSSSLTTLGRFSVGGVTVAFPPHRCNFFPQPSADGGCEYVNGQSCPNVTRFQSALRAFRI